jgi:hypothetical protein
MQIIEIINIIKSIIHTFVRFLPFGLYFFCYFSTIIFKDIRSALLLLGLVLNDILSYVYKRYYKIPDNLNCSILSKPDGTPAPPLPSSHTQYLSFIIAIVFSNQLYKGDSSPFTLIFLSIMLGLTGWSRIIIGCKENYKKVGYEILFGLLRGSLYYYFISTKWQAAEKGKLEREACEFGYNNYKCSTIKDGVVIVKKQDGELKETPKENEDEEGSKKKKTYDSYYDTNF